MYRTTCPKCGAPLAVNERVYRGGMPLRPEGYDPAEANYAVLDEVEVACRGPLTHSFALREVKVRAEGWLGTLVPAALDGRYSSQDARARPLRTLTPAPFTIDDVTFASVEGFRSGLKHSDRYVLGGPLRRVRGNNLRDRSPMAHIAADIAGSQVATLVRQGGRSAGWNAAPLPPTRRRSTD